MSIRFKQGLTLVEIIVGLAIFSAVGAMFVSFIGSSSKEVKFSGDHFNAVVLSQKVSEDLLEEMAINPHGLDTLGIDSSKSNYQEVVDGSSVFFSFLEDRKAPWGKIEPTKDGMISPQVMPLYETVKKFKFNVSGNRLAHSGDHEDRNLLSCDIDFSWKTPTGSGDFNTSCLYFSPATPRKSDLGLAVNQADVDARIPQDVFHQPGKTVPELATDIGENVETILALGRISLVTRDFIQSAFYQKKKAEIGVLRDKLAVTPGIDLENQFELRKKIAKAWYELGQVCFQIVVYLEPHFAELQSQGKFGTGAGSGFNPMTFQQDLFHYRIIYEYFAGCIVQARFYFYSLLQSHLVEYKGGKTQIQILQRLMDIYRIVAILPTRPNGMSEYKAFLNRMKEYSDGRNPFLYRMITQELSFLDNKAQWLERFPNLKRIHGTINEKIPGILAFISKQTIQALTPKTN